MENQLTQEQIANANSVLEAAKAKANASSESYLTELWDYLSASENQLIGLMSVPQNLPDINAAGQPELGLWLFKINNLDNESYKDKLLYEVLHLLGLPETNISSADYSTYQYRLNVGPGVIAGDGTYLTTYQYGGFDEGWDNAAKQYLWHLIGQIGGEIDVIDELFKLMEYLGFIPALHPFNTSSNPITTIPASQQSLTIAIFGDWGAGNNNATLVANAMKSLTPDIYMHLGDVYYAGMPAEETANLLGPLAAFQGNTLFTLNSNHEMYDGATGYFDTALASPLFAAQNNAGYFAIDYGNWVLLGLDSAYFDTQTLHNLDIYMNGALQDPGTGASNPQTDFLNTLQLSGKQVVVFTHHTGVTIDGKQINDPLMSQLYTLLGNRYPDFWYYGHIHDGIVYTNPRALNGLTTPAGKIPQLRCTGNAALPYGVPYFLQDPSIEGIPYFAQTNAGATGQLANAVRNGFATITLSGTQIVETFYEVNLDGSAVAVWTLTTSI